MAGTTATLGTVRQFTGPADPNLDLAGQFDYAVNFSANDPVRTVNGLTFTPDTQAISGASFIGPREVTPWQAKPEFGSSTDANELEEIMADIRWAASPSEKLQATLAVTPGTTYKIQVLISGNNAESRRWDIRLNGQPAVDEITSLGVNPGASYSALRSTVWTHSFTPATTPVTVEMGDFFGTNDGGDRNPIWQALTLERIYVPPAPSDIALTPLQFFPTQTAYIGNFAVTDGKEGTTHTLSLVSGTGATDNAKFSISGGRLQPAPFNFSAQAPGTAYAIRVRATDAADGARWLEKAFTVTLAAPHAPTAVVPEATSLSSGLIGGQSAGLLSATDPDAFDRHAFTLVAGAGADHNAYFAVVGGELRLATILPAGLTAVSLRLRATDLTGLTVETAVVLPVIAPQVRINEVMAAPTAQSLPLDQDGEPCDWIELYNELAQPVNLSGWHLSDDPDTPDKWTFPDLTLPPFGYVIVFASGAGATPASGPPHTNFSLSQSGEHLVLSRPDGVVTSDFNPPELYPNVTWGVGAGGTPTGHLRTPTPAAANSALAGAGRNNVVFSVPHGHRSAAFTLDLTASVPGSVIYYTLDGSVPTTASAVYATPLTITPVVGTTRSGTRIVRALAIHADSPYSPVVTQTYLFVNGVSSPNADGILAQTDFKASIKNHATYGPLMDDALVALPAVSLVINNGGTLPSSETECSIELFDPNGGEPGFTVPAGVTRSGTTSFNYEKGSMSARFRSEYGAAKLSYPLFAIHPYDALGAATEFQEIRLRSGSHDTHSWLGTAENPPVPYGSPPVTRSGDAQFVRNIWDEDMQLLMGQPGKRGRLVQLFVNGSYYGIYHIQEHADDDYMGTYYPGTSDDYHFTGGATTGSTHDTETWSTVWAQLKASLTDYTQAQRWVDTTNLADYMILSFYLGNDWDWSTQHNWSAAGPRLPDQGGWKFFQQDQDIGLQDVNADSTDQDAPDGVFTALMAHADFKVLFRDRIYKHLFHNGVLTPAKAAASYDLRASSIATAVVAETARWQPTSSVGPLPWDRDGEWTVERNYLMNTYFPQRTAVQMNQFRARGWYPVEAPEMSQWGGAVAPGTQVVLTGPANSTIYYTLDGSDPRLPGGAVNPAAYSSGGGGAIQTLVQAYDDIAGRGATWKYDVSATAPAATWKDSGFNDGAWPQGPAECGYGDGDEVTNVGYVGSSSSKNITTYFRHGFNVTNPAAFSGLTIRLKRDDGAVVYLNGQEVFRSNMPAGAVTAATLATAADDDGNTWFTQTLVPAQYTLNAGINVLAVEIHNYAASSSDISFDLELTAIVPTTPQPVIINAAAVLRARALSGSEWSAVNEASFYLTGTQPAGTANVTVSEIHYHPEGTGQGDNEFIEFANTGANPVDMTGVKLGGAVTFTFPSGIVLLPGERVVVVKDPALFDARYRTVGSPWHHAGIRVAGTWSGSLANSGEELIVQAASNAPVFTFAYDDAGAWPGRADGHGSSLELASPSSAPVTLPDKALFLGTATNWRPSSEFHGSPGYAGSGPDNQVVINEISPASIPPDVDFIELFNPSGTSQSIGAWFLSDTSADYRKYRIPAGTSLADGAYLVLNESHFNNPANPGCLAPFALGSSGDDVYLLKADSAGNLLKFIDRVEFGPAPGGMTIGRSATASEGFDLMRGVTPGAPNTAAIPQYAAWVATAFPAGTPGPDAALSADPDHDRITNLAEFCFKLPPLIPNGNPVSITPAANDSPLQVTFKLRNDVPNLMTRLELSTDLATWDQTEEMIERLPAVPQPDGTVSITARVNAFPPAPRRFIRLVLGL